MNQFVLKSNRDSSCLKTKDFKQFSPFRNAFLTPEIQFNENIHFLNKFLSLPPGRLESMGNQSLGKDLLAISSAVLGRYR